MKTSSAFWGALFVFLGLFLLGIEAFDFDVKFSEVAKYWPLLLILIGLSFLKVTPVLKKIFAALAAVLIALILAVLIGRGCSPFCLDVFNDDNYALEDESFEKKWSYSYDESIREAYLDLGAGACSINITKSDKDLCEIYSYLPSKYIDVEIDKDSGSLYLDADLETKKFVFKDSKFGNKVKIGLSEELVWELELGIGAADAKCDLKELKVRKLDISTGATNVECVLGDRYDKAECEIEAGASNIEIKVPESSGCRIIAKTALSGRDFRGFYETDRGWETEDFAKNEKKIIIRISGGVSNFDVSRY